ncbi:MAG: ABC transporter substrate-binding protein [Defluviitaleaceae bacterium]|nr:ABC transporter substrate-binding protein [Defluviitaleaceae bacterium]MCL2275214.1 ABC transporter substrate-binding protein [Defluviitaleaceae bacterium]
MKKFVVFIGLLLAAMFVLSACGSDDAGGIRVSDGEEAEITFRWWGGDARHNATLEAIALFEDRYPHITVNAEFGAFGGFLEQLTMDLAGGTEPDIVQSNFAWVHSLGNGQNVFANHLYLPYLDLTEWSPELRSFTTTADGQLSGVSHGITGRVIIYSRDMLAQHGLSAFPATFDEWIALGERISADNTAIDTGANRYAFFPLGDQTLDIVLMTIILNEFNVNLQSDGRILPTIDQVEYAFNVLGRMIDSGTIPTMQQQEAPHDATNPVWMQGRGGSVFEWVGNIGLPIGNFLDGNEADLGVALLPATRAGGTQNSMQRTSLVHAVTQASVERGTHYIASYFLNWFYTDEGALRLLGNQFGIPLSRTAARISAEEGNTRGLQLAGLHLLEANVGDMCHLFEDPSLRDPRFFAIDAFRYGQMNARQAAEHWVNEQQAALR